MPLTRHLVRLAGLLALGSMACAPERSSQLSSSGPLQLDSGVALETAVVMDTIDVGQTVQFWMILKNGGGPTEVNNHPDRLMIEVETSTGQRVEPSFGGSMDDFLGGMGHFVMPRRSVLARLLALDCIGSGYGPRAGCYYGFNLTSPGAYRLITTFRGFELEPGRERVLVDTAAVTVRAME